MSNLYTAEEAAKFRQEVMRLAVDLQLDDQDFVDKVDKLKISMSIKMARRAGKDLVDTVFDSLEEKLAQAKSATGGASAAWKKATKQ